MKVKPAKNSMEIGWKVNKNDRGLLKIILDRFAKASKDHGLKFSRIDLEMSLIACHNHGVRIDLDRLSKAPDEVLVHDVFGINRHISKDTGELRNFFQPKCVMKDSVGRSL